MRIRISFSKTADLRYTSILDLQKVWERAARRAQMGLQYSQGFHPQAKIQIANPLPLGFSGKNELVDLWIADFDSIHQIQQRLLHALPNGMAINAIEILPENAPSLPKQVESSQYRITFHDPQPEVNKLKNKVSGLLTELSIIRVRNGKSYDLRPLISSLEILLEDGKPTQIILNMPSGPGKTGRPEEVMFELGFQWQDFQVERTRLVLGEAQP